MTKVEIRYAMDRLADESIMGSINRAHGHYGLQSVRLTPAMDGLVVTYDASRMMLEDVDRALHNSGLPVRRVEK